MYVLDSSLKLRYRGRIDDQFTVTDRSVGVRKDRPEVSYLTAALDSLLAGAEVKVKQTEAVGCVIGRRLRSTEKTTVTYHRDVEPIFQRRCQSCHREGEIGPFELKTYDDAAGWAGMIEEVVENRRLPPWHANPEHENFANDRSLSAEERQTILAWVGAGAPRGDPKVAPPPTSFPSGWAIGTPDAVFAMPREFVVPAKGTLKYQYFVVKTDFEQDRWIRAVEVRPGSRETVHHVLVFAIDPQDPRRSRREAGGGTRGYFAAAVPGENPAMFGDGRAKRLPAVATLVFQVHYTTNGREQRDRSKIGLYFAGGPVKEVRTRSVVTVKGLRIPPATEAHAVSAYRHFSKPLRIVSMLPHMHIRGSAFTYFAHYPVSGTFSKSPPTGDFPRDIRKRVRYDAGTKTLTWTGEMTDEAYGIFAHIYPRGDDRDQLDRIRKIGRTEILLDVPAYDFGWQSSYQFEQPKLIPKNTVLEGRAVYNNSSSNAALTKKMWQKEVRWGDQTWEEMLIGYFDAVEVDEPRRQDF